MSVVRCSDWERGQMDVDQYELDSSAGESLMLLVGWYEWQPVYKNLSPAKVLSDDLA